MVGESTGDSGTDSIGPKSAAYRLTDHLTPIDCKQFVTRHDGNCFALPIPLLNVIRSQLKDCLPREDYEAERSFGEFCDRLHLLGFWNNAPIFDPYTPFTGKVRTERYADRSVPLRDSGDSAWERRVQLFRLGYVGWLLTSKLFREEQARLLSEWNHEILQCGIAGVAQPPPHYSSIQAISGAYSQEFSLAVKQFLARWRIVQFFAADVPVPLEPLTRGFLPASANRRTRESGGVFYLPDTFPIPSRDELRDALRDGLSGPNSDHLVEWLAIVRSTGGDGKRIGTFARSRVLWCYWRSLISRYGNTLRRKKEPLVVAFAEYLACDDATIKRALRLIQSRLGRDWAVQT